MRVALVVAFMCVGSVGLFYAVIFLPRWFTRSMHGHRLWRLRDSFVDDIIAGRLPREHPAVQRALSDIEWAVRNGKTLKMLDVYLCLWLFRRMETTSRKEFAKTAAVPSFDGLTAEQSALLRERMTSFTTLLAGSLMLGSWLGLATVARFVPQALAEAVRKKGAHWGGRVRSSLRDATDLAATETRLGQYSTDLATRRHAMPAPGHMASSVSVDQSALLSAFRS